MAKGKPPPFPPKKSKAGDVAMPAPPFGKKKGPPMPMMNKGGAIKKK